MMPFRLIRLSIIAGLIAAAPALAPTGAQERSADGARANNPGLPGWCETPVEQRKAEPGCYTTAITKLGLLPKAPLYWHLDTYPDKAAAEANKTPRSTVVDGHGKHWLFTIADQAWRPKAGERVAMIGPLIVDRGVSYTAHYLETVIEPGFQDGKMGHRHSGPEAWYIVSGGQCLETPNGVMAGVAGQSMMAPEGWPMAIASIGDETRRAVVLVLHRTSEPYTSPVNSKPDAPHAHWEPKGACANVKVLPGK
ncbi:MAG TPA: hypothetical protein VGO52_24575 [Hyphomonadaceae bacterium]|nr:hypothetical protein [Hyphomonadaceae bacterium]